MNDSSVHQHDGPLHIIDLERNLCHGVGFRFCSEVSYVDQFAILNNGYRVTHQLHFGQQMAGNKDGRTLFTAELPQIIP
ncbi:hypothetical protein D1872_311490 [compost metagenome]